jgi:hypothetical protein
VGPRVGLDAVAKKIILSPCRESNPGRPARSQVAKSTEISWFFPKMKTVLYVRKSGGSSRDRNLECSCVLNSTVKIEIKRRTYL